MEHGQRMVPWLVIVAFLALHICALSPLSPWGTPTRVTLHRPLSRLHYANDKGPLTEQEQNQEKTLRIWESLFGKFRKALTTPEVKDAVATAQEEVHRVAGKQLDYAMERGKKDINETIEVSFSFSPTLQQILKDMKKKAEEDMKTVGNFFRGEDGGIGADKAVRIVNRSDREKEGATEEEVS